VIVLGYNESPDSPRCPLSKNQSVCDPKITVIDNVGLVEILFPYKLFRPSNLSDV